MAVSTATIKKMLRTWMKLPHIQKAFTANSINFSSACTEVLCSRVIAKLMDSQEQSPSPRTTPWRYKINYFFDLVALLIRHPIVGLRWLIHLFLPRSFSQIPADILVFSNGLHLASYASLFKSLSQHTKVHVATSRQDFLDAFYLSQYHLYPHSINFTQVKIDQPTLHQLQNQLSKISYPKHKYSSIINQCLKQIAASFLPKFFYQYSQAQKIINQINPSLLITTHDPGPSATAFVMVAKQRQIPTLVLLHGIPSDGWYFFSDQLLLWGKRTKAFLKQLIPAHKLILGTQPIFYDYQQYFLHHHRLSSRIPQIGIILSRYGLNQSYEITYLRSLISEISKLIPNAHFLIRLHPGQYLDTNLEVNFSFGQTIEEFTSSCDIIITQTSTAALIAALSSCPVIYFPENFPLINNGILWKFHAFSPVVTAKHAAKRTQQLLSSPSFKSSYLERQHQQALAITGPINPHSGEDLARNVIDLYFSSAKRQSSRVSIS